jgi:hypothetical protein
MGDLVWVGSRIKANGEHSRCGHILVVNLGELKD